MKKLPYIRKSIKFYGKFEVVVTPELIIPCYNLASAKSIVSQHTKESKTLDKHPFHLKSDISTRKRFNES